MRRHHGWVLLATIALSLLLTWPLAMHFTSHVPGDGIDDPALAWNLWWVKHALVDQPQNPFACSWMFWPVGINLGFYTLTILNGLLSVPLQTVLGLIPAYNLLLLSSFVLGGYGAFLLCRDFLAHEAGREGRPGGTWWLLAGPCLGGALYAFASAKLFYASLGQGNIASSQWAPFAALYLARTVRARGRPRDAALAALFLVLQAYAELTYASFLAIFALLAAVWGWWRSARRPALVARLALLAVLFLAGITPFLAAMLPDLAAEGDFFSSGGGFSDLYSADLAGYALPTQLHPLLGGIVRQVANNSATRADGSSFPVDKGQQIYVGYTALALAVAGLWAGRRARTKDSPSNSLASPGRWFWGVSALVFFLLTLGPSLRVAGHDLHVPLPFALVAQLPFFKGNRYPSRYSVMLLLSLAPLVALGLWKLQARLRLTRPRCAGLVFPLLLILLLFEHLSAPLPLFDLRVPALYQQVAADPVDGALWELPSGWRNGARVLGKQDILIMQELWYQTVHGKRILGGNTSRNPEFKFQYFSEDPTLGRFIALTNAADLPQQHTALSKALAAATLTNADRARAQAWAGFLGLRYVMVHRDKLPAQAETELKALLPVELVAEDGALALYRVAADLPRPRRFDLAGDDGHLTLAEGWSPAGGEGTPSPAGTPSPPASTPSPPALSLGGRGGTPLVNEGSLPSPAAAGEGLGEGGSCGAQATPSPPAGTPSPPALSLGGRGGTPLVNEGSLPSPAAAGEGLGEGGSPLGEGASCGAVPVWAQRREVRLLLPLDAGGTRVRLYGQAAAAGQQVTLVVDGRALAAQPMGQEPGWLTFPIPPDPGRPLLSDVRLRFSALAPVAGTSGGPWPIGSTGVASRASILVRGAGQETGDFAHIFVDGVDVSPASRGYNLVALDPTSGRVLAQAAFDTHLDKGAGARLAGWVRALPAGVIVAGATKDEASMSLSQAGVDALRSLGVAGDLRGHFRWGQAFLGVTGAGAGSALEAMDGVRPAQVSVGLPASGPQVAAAVWRVEVGE